MLLAPSAQILSDFRGSLTKITGESIYRREKDYLQARKKLDSELLLKKIYKKREIVKNLENVIISGTRNILVSRSLRLRLLLQNLENNNPSYILKKGFAIIYDDKKQNILRGLDKINIGQIIKLVVEEGSVSARVLEKKYKKGRNGSR